ncbi:hypothetical protein AB5I41_24610 [Sphingomonas sp. MMS24-JH45]
MLLTLLVATLPAMRPIKPAANDLRVEVTGEQILVARRLRAVRRRGGRDRGAIRIPVGRTVALG